MTPLIVFLDRDTTDIGDLDFSELESLGEVAYFGNTTSPADLAERVTDAQIILTNKVVINSAAMDAAKNLELIQVAATGVNNVDLEAAQQRKIPVCNVSGYSTPAVAQHVFSLLLNLVTHVNRYTASPERWAESPFFTRLDYPISELSGKTFGIVGFGGIGKAVAKIASAFGMRLVALARAGSSTTDTEIERLTHDAFFAECDVISLHCPLTEDNYQWINAGTLSKMKSSAYLINTGRGDLINEADLISALENGTIAGAGLDVISVEPPPANHPIISANLPNLLVTPHTAWSSRESRQRLIDEVAINLRAMQRGEERNRVV